MTRVKKSTALLLSMLLLVGLAAGCDSTPSDPDPDAVQTLPPLSNAEKLALWDDDYADGAFANAGDVLDVAMYIDRELTDSPPAEPADSDIKYLFSGDVHVRAVNLADGYAITLPKDDSLTTDFTFSALRSKFLTDSYTLTVSKEINSYGKNEEGWQTYFDEWLVRFIGNDRFIHRNALERTREVTESMVLLDGYTVHLYSVYILENENIAQPYYNIAIVREIDNYTDYFLFNCKSSFDMTGEFDAIVASLREFAPTGVAKNDEGPYQPIIPANWNEATRNYYEKLQTQEHVSWGFFTNSMPEDSDSEWASSRERMERNQTFFQDAFEHTFEIIPTYLHIGWHGHLTGSPNRMYEEFAGGDGFNGKPVLHQSYQFTTSNNSQLTGYTPMFQILNGYYDDHLREIARGFKEYGHPVLFRLNNEMDTDWTSYCAPISLLDPDIFIMTWERMYRIFEEEGVDNTIWVFNPNGVSIPFSKWGQWQNYLPSLETVQVLGITSYESGNNDAGFRSFASHYREQYERFVPYFENYPWSISEFACGAGGAKRNVDGEWRDTVAGRGQFDQADWVKAMFGQFRRRGDPDVEYLKHIKIAIWFSANDDTPLIDGAYHIVNYYRITPDLTMTIEEFRKGLNPE